MSYSYLEGKDGSCNSIGYRHWRNGWHSGLSGDNDGKPVYSDLGGFRRLGQFLSLLWRRRRQPSWPDFWQNSRGNSGQPGRQTQTQRRMRSRPHLVGCRADRQSHLPLFDVLRRDSSAEHAFAWLLSPTSSAWTTKGWRRRITRSLTR